MSKDKNIVESELRAICPFCDSLTQTGRQDAKFYLNTATGLFYCFHCGIKGKDLSDEVLERLNVIDEIARRPFDQSCLAKLMEKAPELENFLKTRALSTLKGNKVAAKRLWFSKEYQAIAMPVCNVSGDVVGVKYRKLDPAANPRYISETGSINEGYWLKGEDETKLLILEGEIDALTALHCGFKGNIMACQTNRIPESQLKAIRSHQNVFILADKDLGGEQLKVSANELLGALNPIFISLPEGIAKDLNEYLQRSGYEQCNQFIAENTRTTLEKATVGFFECTSEMVEFLSNKRNTKGTSTGFNALDRLLGGGIRDKELTIVSAGTGVGKTSFLNNLIHNVAMLGEKVGIVSMEMDGPTELSPSILSIASSFDFRSLTEKDEMLEAASLIQNDYSYLNNIKYFRKEGRTNFQLIMDWVKLAGPFNYLIIDHVGFLVEDIAKSSETRSLIEEVRDFTRQNNLKTVLAIQQGRGDHDPMARTDGGIGWAQPCQNFIYLQRNKNDELLLEAHLKKTRYTKGFASKEPVLFIYDRNTCALKE